MRELFELLPWSSILKMGIGMLTDLVRQGCESLQMNLLQDSFLLYFPGRRPVEEELSALLNDLPTNEVPLEELAEELSCSEHSFPGLGVDGANLEI